MAIQTPSILSVTGNTLQLSTPTREAGRCGVSQSGVKIYGVICGADTEECHYRGFINVEKSDGPRWNEFASIYSAKRSSSKTTVP